MIIEAFISVLTSAPCVGLVALSNFYLSKRIIRVQLVPSIMTTVLILIGVLQGCIFIGNGGGGIILLVLVKKLRDK